MINGLNQLLETNFAHFIGRSNLVYKFQSTVYHIFFFAGLFVIFFAELIVCVFMLPLACNGPRLIDTLHHTLEINT